MKNIFILLLVTVLSLSSVLAEDIEDTSIIDELEKQEIKEIDFDFNLKSFETCDGLEKVMWNYIKEYWKNNKNRWNYPIAYRTLWAPNIDVAFDDGVSSDKSESSISNESISWAGSDDFSETNVQVKWVDESDIVKTDWKYIYYYNELDRYVYIVEAVDLWIIKKIKLPSNFNRPVLYIWEDRLTIISSGYSNTNYSKFGYWINRNSKTYTIVFDTTNIKIPVLTKLYVADWDLRKSRKIGDYIYVISNNNFAIPYHIFESEADIDVDIKNILPKKIDISKTGDESKQNLKLRWLDLPYNITAWDIANCNEIEYVLPDPETMKQFDFSPSYNIISIIDTKNTENEVKTKVIAWSNAELYMSLDNMYLTSHMYQSYDFSCPVNARCFAPWYPRGQNTLVHKVNIDGSSLKYQDSTIVPGSPLTQYSMDEYKWDFRILTSINTWGRERNQYTDLYILDENLELKWSLTNLGEWENFKSSRYIWDKLFLVTFKQIDPLFVIDVSDSTNPEVLWELKIPGYSTYLHPYDENHLIGLGYDTKENKWWGTINDGVKVDLYEIDYDKTSKEYMDKKNDWIASDFVCTNWFVYFEDGIWSWCEDPNNKWILVKQKFSHTLWQYWSYSEALTNPRMFMWKAKDNKLFLPATLYINDELEQYRHLDFFQWLITMTIDKDDGIKEDFRLSHINYSWLEKERQKECLKYTKENTEKKCVKLIGWWEYCEAVKYSYIPKYCYENSSIWEYIASKSWNYRNSFIKRALWIGNNTYSISNDEMRSSNINTGIKTDSVKMWK